MTRSDGEVSVVVSVAIGVLRIATARDTRVRAVVAKATECLFEGKE